MTGRGDTQPGEGVSLRGVRPALRISPATWLLVLLLERGASPLSCSAPASREAGTLTRPLRENCFTVCFASPTIFAPALDPFGELTSTAAV